MSVDSFGEVLELANNKSFSETGGAHNQKGVEFQRNWALVRMFELEAVEPSDFLFLFEAIQDIALFDSDQAPTNVKIFQVKKKDRNEWTWSSLTKLHAPKARKKKPLEMIAGSPLGRIYVALHAIKKLSATAHFISNVGCDLALMGGANAATSLPVPLEKLTPQLSALLVEGLATLQAKGEPSPDLSKIYVERVAIPVDDCATYTVGVAHAFLAKRSPSHAGQAKALVDTLLAKIGPLGAKTDTCATFEELRAQRGYSRSDFLGALTDLQDIPDLLEHLNLWLIQLSSEGMGHIEITRIRSSAASIYRRNVLGSHAHEDDEIAGACDDWLCGKVDPVALLPFFREGEDHLRTIFPLRPVAFLQAQFALRAIKWAVEA
ncbi:dsDNA nuclease domain-containing protein [Bradyrhizobium sp. 199]|uniref:dsDNA nuclease domain-containing protein n=1 Tax=Bradyrhizobium sp. 199 TaxID=2782664 RepID=UPI001FFBE459|nr:dsDNA nuclease domain-containing protein [Bradyrhizobium sp. 199]MCK1361308.1 DUF4297 domain-containing protein [Bradyrhizobium sp. 199]